MRQLETESKENMEIMKDNVNLLCKTSDEITEQSNLLSKVLNELDSTLGTIETKVETFAGDKRYLAGVESKVRAIDVAI